MSGKVTPLRKATEASAELMLPLTRELDAISDQLVHWVPAGDDKIARVLMSEAPKACNRLGAHGIDITPNDIVPLMVCRQAQIIADLREAIKNGHG